MNESGNGSNSEQSFYNSNAGYTGESILKVRLDTQLILQNIDMFLRSSRTVIKTDANGMVSEEIVRMGTPLANETGIHSILAYVNATINAQIVQGNYEWDHWREEVSWIREQLATDVFVNYDIWGIDPQNINLICNVVMNTIKPFLTRLVNNEERKSYSNYAQTTTVQGPSNSGGMFAKLFGR